MAASSKSTATPDNALTPEEVDTRLRSATLARLATFRADGMIHLTPIWFDWNGSVFQLSLGSGRVHLKNLAADPRVTILIDEDSRLEHGLAAGAWAIECRGIAELSDDEALIREVTHRTLVKAMGATDAEQYTEPVMAEGRVIVTIAPKTWHTWDYNKVE